MDHERYRRMRGHTMPSMEKMEFEVALKGKKQIAEGTMAFVFEKPNGCHFKAGQHIRMTLINPPETDSEDNGRFFSLASTPQDADLVIAMRMRDTAFKRVLGRMQIGETALIQILLDVPHGAFALHDDASKPAVMLVGGIGVVPAYSMIKDATERKLPRKIFLFYSNRRPEDAPYLDELQKLAKQNPSFKLIATMTEPEKSAHVWQGETGFINHSMLRRYVDDPQSPIYYIAGLPEMVSAMKILLADLGIKEGYIQVEEFSGFTMEHNNDRTLHGMGLGILKGKRHSVLVAVVLMIIAFVILHALAANSIYKAGGFSLKNPLSYLMIGGFLVVAAFKLTYLWRFKRGIGKHFKK
jgi:ferredoxin-NADP reductase